jgi:hypothetical protein
MTDELNLTLPERRPAGSRLPKPVLALLLILAILAAANLAVSVRKRAVQSPQGLSPSKLKEVALKLEQRDLKGEAVSAWREVLASPGSNAEERAKIWFRVGSLEQEAGHDGAALAAYYRSEAEAFLKDMAPEISLRVQQCLEHSGQFADLQHELRERTNPQGAPPKAGDAVVAEIGPRKVTLEELDRRIERTIDLQLGQFATALPAEERAMQREALLKRFSTQAARESELQRFLTEEVLVRKAREDRLPQDPAVRDLLEMAERQILAQQEMRGELSSRIHITELDLKTFYEAHKADYKEKKEGAAERQKTFEEARPEVYASLRRQKEQEVQGEMFAALVRKYDVVLHREALGQPAGEEPQAGRQKTPS